MGSDKEQTETITLELLIKKLTEYEKGRMILLKTEEYEKLIAYITQQQTQEQRLKKIEELLDLYQQLSVSKRYNVERVAQTYKQIQQLEKELNL